MFSTVQIGPVDRKWIVVYLAQEVDCSTSSYNHFSKAIMRKRRVFLKTD